MSPDATSCARDAGIAKAVDHADAVAPAWSDRAFSFLVDVAPKLGTFTGPQIREMAAAAGIDHPPSDRAWGGPFNKAARRGLIVEAGFTRASDDMHYQPIRVWRAA